MGRPIKPAFVGKPSDYVDNRNVIMFEKAWISGSDAISTQPVYIIQQTGAARYLVSDGVNTGTVYLVDEITESGQGIINVTVGTNVYPASKITLHRVDTFSNGSYAWTFTDDNVITNMTGTEYTTAINPPAPTTPTTPTETTKTTVDPDTVVQESDDGTVSIPAKD